jgi:hypothetical protein
VSQDDEQHSDSPKSLDVVSVRHRLCLQTSLPRPC